MLDAIVDCHKCKYEFNGECVPRSQKMKFPNCYKRTQTNADKIRQMSDEELAMLFQPTCPLCDECPSVGEIKDCYKCWLDWLKQEVDGGADK